MAYIYEIGPSLGKIKLSYERNRLCYLCANSLFVCAGNGDHCRNKLWLEGILVGERDRVLVLESLSETAYQKKKKFVIHRLAIQVSLCF
jgi:hypothetical protein